jgi:hypothetical protein
MMKEYWLHIRDDGTESIYTEPPPSSVVKTLHVWVVNDFYEITKTYNLFPGGDEPQIAVPPKGDGWEVLPTSEQGASTTWTRLRRAR